MQYRIVVTRKFEVTEQTEAFVEAKTVRAACISALKKIKDYKPSAWEEVDCKTHPATVISVSED